MGELLSAQGVGNGGYRNLLFQPAVVGRRERNLGSGAVEEERRYHNGGGKGEPAEVPSQETEGVGGQGGDKQWVRDGYISTGTQVCELAPPRKRLYDRLRVSSYE